MKNWEICRRNIYQYLQYYPIPNSSIFWKSEMALVKLQKLQPSSSTLHLSKTQIR